MISCAESSPFRRWTELSERRWIGGVPADQKHPRLQLATSAYFVPTDSTSTFLAKAVHTLKPTQAADRTRRDARDRAAGADLT